MKMYGWYLPREWVVAVQHFTAALSKTLEIRLTATEQR